ncbi:MAG: orotidine-5'-phosphate decarboxylase [Thermoplasmatota archaeon]
MGKTIFTPVVDMNMPWKQKLRRSIDVRKTLLCVGLDTDLGRFPSDLIRDLGGQVGINREIVSATSDLAAAYKPNLAFYEKEGPEGIRALHDTVRMIREEAPGSIVILDAKRGDIGNTSKAYASAAFDSMKADSITVNAYMGKDAVIPFSADPEKLVFVLCRTSNQAASEIQDLEMDGEPLYLRMARIIKGWNDNDNLGLVVGATFPEELKRIREAVGFDMPILVPGVGAQGGDLRPVLEYGTDISGSGVLINVSRGIMFAFQNDGGSLGESARQAASGYYQMIRSEMEKLGRW